MSKIKLILVAVLLTAAIGTCGGNEDTVGPASMDRDKFIGNWAGTYECSSSPADTMFIAPGSGALDFSITLHAEVFDPDVVTAELTGPNTITIPEQTIGFFPGSGEITFSNNRLSLVQKGLGLTCRGSDYVKY